MTTRDDQTGLMNLGAFSFVVDHVVRRATRAGECATILSIGIGDYAGGRNVAPPSTSTVYRVARMLRTELRGEDVIARLGPREFGVALPDTDGSQAETVVAWITSLLTGADGGEALDEPVSVGRVTFEPTQGPVATDALLAAARQSRSGPSSLTGSPARAPEETLGSRGGARREGAPRDGAPRHLRSLRSPEA